MSGHYYDYKSLNPATINNQYPPWHWENPADWPRTFLYIPNQDGVQGLHPPAPVYQSNQPSQQAMYYFPGSSSSPAGYYVNGIYYGTSAPSASTGWPYTSYSSSSGYTCYPFPTTSASITPSYYPYTYSPYCTAPAAYQMPQPFASIWPGAPGPGQAAAAIAANAALAAMPNAPAYFVGATPAEIQAQNAILLANMQASAQQPSQLVPFKPGSSPQFWCKELDGSWTLKEYNDALKSDFPTGHWEKHATSGYHYYVRH